MTKKTKKKLPTTVEQRLMVHWQICELLTKVDLDSRVKIVKFLATVYCDEKEMK